MTFSMISPVRRLLLEQSAIVFYHPRPSWPTHVLLVPRCAIGSYRDIAPTNVHMVSSLFSLAPRVAYMLQLGPREYSLLLNGEARQDVGQLHVHLVAPPLEVPAGATLCPFAASGLARGTELLSACAWLRSRRSVQDRKGFSLLAQHGLEGSVYLVHD